MISATVSDYNNETLTLLEKWLRKDVRLLHNAHDGDKIAVNTKSGIAVSSDIFKLSLKHIIERPVSYQDKSLIMTAGIKIYT
jgi:hypothetical protein